MRFIIEIWIFRNNFLSAVNFEFGEFMNLKSCTFTLNMCLVIGQNPVTRKVSVVSHFKPSG